MSNYISTSCQSFDNDVKGCTGMKNKSSNETNSNSNHISYRLSNWDNLTSSLNTITTDTSMRHTTSRVGPLINVGPGTTATHAMYTATCNLGIPSVHFTRTCLSDKRRATCEGIPPDLVNILLLHKRAKQAYSRVYTQAGKPNSKFGMDVRDWQNYMKSTFVEMLQYKDVVMAFHDVPYPCFATTMMKAMKKVYNVTDVSQTNFILSYRDPIKWAKSRIQNHALLVCKDNLDEIDLDGCIDRAVERRKTDPSYYNSTDKILVKDVFHRLPMQRNASVWLSQLNETIVQVLDGTNLTLSEIVEGLSNGMQRHMERFHRPSMYAVDIFSYHPDGRRVENMELANDIETSIVSQSASKQWYNRTKNQWDKSIKVICVKA